MPLATAAGQQICPHWVKRPDDRQYHTSLPDHLLRRSRCRRNTRAGRDDNNNAMPFNVRTFYRTGSASWKALRSAVWQSSAFMTRDAVDTFDGGECWRKIGCGMPGTLAFTGEPRWSWHDRASAMLLPTDIAQYCLVAPSLAEFKWLNGLLSVWTMHYWPRR